MTTEAEYKAIHDERIARSEARSAECIDNGLTVMERDVVVIREYNPRNSGRILKEKYSIESGEGTGIYKDIMQRHPSLDLIKRRQEQTN